MVDYDKMTRRFLMGESLDKPGLMEYIQHVGEILSSIRPTSKQEARRIAVAKESIKQCRKHAKRLEERVRVLEEELKPLQEKK
tara:strand:+ start:762 stop:1010 length:249 start_codon:yes stop_codon:yes gene_type:complete